MAGGPPAEGDPNLGRIVSGDDFLIKLKRLEHQTEGGETERLMQDIGKFLRVVTISSVKIVSK